MTSLSDEWIKQSDYDLNTARDMFNAGISIQFTCATWPLKRR